MKSNTDFMVNGGFFLNSDWGVWAQLLAFETTLLICFMSEGGGGDHAWEDSSYGCIKNAQ